MVCGVVARKRVSLGGSLDGDSAKQMLAGGRGELTEGCSEFRVCQMECQIYGSAQT